MSSNQGLVQKKIKQKQWNNNICDQIGLFFKQLSCSPYCNVRISFVNSVHFVWGSVLQKIASHNIRFIENDQIQERHKAFYLTVVHAITFSRVN